MKYAANCSMLFTELPLLERPAAAKAAGFEGIEFWWPFATAVPDQRDIDAFVEAVKAADVQLIGLNFFAGDMPGGDRGTLSLPERSEEFRANVPVAMEIADALGCRAFNALYGNRVPDADPEAQDELAVENLTLAAEAAESRGGTVLLEPVSGAPRYPLLTAADILAVIERVQQAHGAANIGFLCDLYHLATNGDDLELVTTELVPHIAHVQIADAPGRGEPGSGALPLGHLLANLKRAGYDGWIALEYKPTTATTNESLIQLPPLP